MSYKSEHLTPRVDISNASNSFFAKNFNDVLLLVWKEVSSKTKITCRTPLNEKLLLKAIQRTKSSCALTSDSFLSKILHLCPQFFASIFLPLFSSIILTCSFPLIWKITYINPMFKSGVKNDIAKYRPISLLPKVSFVFERQLFNFFDGIRHHIIPSQFRFQSRKSAVLQELDFIETIKFGNFEQQYIQNLDYDKALDKVPLNVLLWRFSRFGLDDKVLELLSSSVNDRHQLVIFCGYLPNTIRVISGVSQVSVLGPLLFLILINDSPAIFLASISCLFADNLKLLFQLWKWHR